MSMTFSSGCFNRLGLREIEPKVAVTNKLACFRKMTFHDTSRNTQINFYNVSTSFALVVPLNYVAVTREIVWSQTQVEKQGIYKVLLVLSWYGTVSTMGCYTLVRTSYVRPQLLTIE